MTKALPRPALLVRTSPRPKKRVPRQERTRILRHIGEIEEARDLYGIPIANLCRTAGISDRQYRRIVRGFASPLTSTLEALRQAVEVLRNRAGKAQQTLDVIGKGADYATIPALLRVRREELKIPCIELDAIMGVSEGHTNKLENWDKGYGRGYGEASLALWCEALGVEIAVVRTTLPIATQRFISRIAPEDLRRRVRPR